MKKEQRKTPKTNQEKYILSVDAEACLYGLILILLAIIGILNTGFVGEAITFVFAYVFGAFYLLAYILLIFFGLYLMIKKSFYNLKIDLKVLGLILLILGVSISASLEYGIYINSFFGAYNDRISTISSSLAIHNVNDIYENLGGGFIGYFLAGCLNSAVQPFGSKIIVIILISVGLILSLKDIFVSVVSFFIRLHKNRVEIRKEEKDNRKINTKEIEEETVEEVEKITPSTIINESIEELEEEIIEEKNNTFDFDQFFYSKKEEDDIDNVTHFVEETPFVQPIIPEVKVEETVEKEEAAEEEIISTKVEETIITPTYIPVEEEVKVVVREEKIVKKNDYSKYVYPPLTLLKDAENTINIMQKNAIANERVNLINECFDDFKIGARVVSYSIGPSVTRFDVRLNSNVRANVLSSIENDLALRLGGIKTVRVETIVEGKSTSGIEVGNIETESVAFKDCMKEVMQNSKDRLLFPLGKDVNGDVITCKLDETPHMLVCGTTGSGKSVFIHNIISSLLMRNSPEELRLLLIDPKVLELKKYNNIPHLLCPVITTTEEGKAALKALVDEMERRYEILSTQGMGASSLKEYDQVCIEKGYERLPYIVMVCDEFADFMIEGDKEVAKYIQRIAQKARACGIHMIIATQRPSAKVITGEIKSNIPSRIALSVSSNLESRIIIDDVGAENLLGKGDLLARIPNKKFLVRVQSAYISNQEIYQLSEFLRKQGEFVCDPHFDNLLKKEETILDTVINEDSPLQVYKDFHNDEKYEQIKRFVIESGKCSTTKLQNTFGIGFSRADGILDTLEQDGIIIRENNRRVLSPKYRNSED